jgi:hypothetical protein
MGIGNLVVFPKLIAFDANQLLTDSRKGYKYPIEDRKG